MTRMINDLTTTVAPLVAPSASDLDDLPRWAAAQMQAYGLRWLLAYADDGVIWGELREGTLHTSASINGLPKLRALTLQRCHMFGLDAELLLRRVQGGWQANLRQDGHGDLVRSYDERLLLWGDVAEPAIGGFLLLREGTRGIMHAPPLAQAPSHNHRAALTVRHYLTTDPETGLQRVSATRLVALHEPSEKE
ncbi:MAG: CRISPR-associated protein Csx19 [Roseiflexaceae bacterium]